MAVARQDGCRIHVRPRADIQYTALICILQARTFSLIFWIVFSHFNAHTSLLEALEGRKDDLDYMPFAVRVVLPPLLRSVGPFSFGQIGDVSGAAVPASGCRVLLQPDKRYGSALCTGRGSARRRMHRPCISRVPRRLRRRPSPPKRRPTVPAPGTVPDEARGDHILGGLAYCSCRRTGGGSVSNLGVFGSKAEKHLIHLGVSLPICRQTRISGTKFDIWNLWPTSVRRCRSVPVQVRAGADMPPGSKDIWI